MIEPFVIKKHTYLHQNQYIPPNRITTKLGATPYQITSMHLKDFLLKEEMKKKAGLGLQVNNA